LQFSLIYNIFNSTYEGDNYVPSLYALTTIRILDCSLLCTVLCNLPSENPLCLTVSTVGKSGNVDPRSGGSQY